MPDHLTSSFHNYSYTTQILLAVFHVEAISYPNAISECVMSLTLEFWKLASSTYTHSFCGPYVAMTCKLVIDQHATPGNYAVAV